MKIVKKLLRKLITLFRKGKRVSIHDKISRLNTCYHCSKLDREDDSCTICGCFVDSKTSLAAAQCPHDPPFWNKVDNKSA